MQLPDLTALSLAQFAALLLLVAAVDTAVGILAAIVTRTFVPSAVADFLRTHVLARVLPIFGLALFGHGIAALGVPAIPAAGVAASAALAAYVVETLGSLQATLTRSTIISVTQPVLSVTSTTASFPPVSVTPTRDPGEPA